MIRRAKSDAFCFMHFGLIRVFLKLQAEKYLGLGESCIGMIFLLFMGVNLFLLIHFSFFIVVKT